MRGALLLVFKTFSVLTAFAVFISACLFIPFGATASPEATQKVDSQEEPTEVVEISEEKTQTATQAATQVFLPLVSNTPTPPTEPPPDPSDGSWPMAGGNPQRTSWTPTEVRGRLEALWYKPFEAYILHRTQIIAEYGNLYISTSKGLYALNSNTGAEKWVYPTELPLGNSPTVKDGVVYVGGFDHQLHAIDAQNGEGLWTFTAGAGFDTNPLVVDGKVFAGNRDGFFYAVHAEGASAGQLAWKFQTQGPIHFSAAYKDGVIYFASDDSHAYALNTQSGGLVWKSAKLPGAGFHSWWPVIYRDMVILAGSNNYRTSIGPGPADQITHMELEDVYPNHQSVPKGTLVGPLGAEPGGWVEGTPTIDTSKSNAGSVPITEYFEDKPWRRTYFVLNRATGQEVTYDFDGDGQPEYAPILWLGTHSGNRYPPVIGSDGVLYQGNNYKSDSSIAGGHISGWEIGTPYISVLNNDWNAVDEPVAYAAGGDLIYWNRCCDRVGGAIDVTIPEPDALNPRAPLDPNAPERSWSYFSYNLPDKVPGYNEMTYVYEPYDSPFGGVFGGRNGSYGFHGDVNPPIPYNGKVFMHRSNAVIAFAQNAGQASKLPTAQVVEVGNAGLPALSDTQIKALLQTQVNKILDAGHLRPGYMSTGIFDLGAGRTCGADLIDYFHNPADTLATLLRALQYLPADMQGQVRTYLQNEYDQYPPYQYDHVGWRDGTAREIFTLPPEVEADLSNYGPEQGVSNFAGWNFNPFAFYALWKYADEFGNAKSIFDTSKSKLNAVPSNDVLLEMPHVHNAFIAGYWGYLELENLAGYPESANVRNELNRLLELRASQFSIELPDVFFPASFSREAYCRSLSIARNFIYLTPELGDYLSSHASSKVENAVQEYTRMAPYWFVAWPETAFAEGVLNHYYDVYAIFQAKALILGESRQELSKYVDVPGFPVGDLFYIENLISLLEAN
jgi:outer membrane protein assembly factor BamB